ncbi:MAG: COQ9 family protein, partial [Rhodospirillaceae bacterium]|nr:COQ9 family protein [Rhodospirillaceae bacterium]
TDFNYYTKRGLLAGVYGSTILYWLSDNSDDFVETDAFLARRINEVLQIPKLQSKITKRLERLTRPLRRFKRPAF